MIKIVKESPEIFNVYRTQFESDRRFLPLITNEEYYRSFLSFYSIQYDSSIVGFIFQYLSNKIILENAIVILPAHRRKGYGLLAIDSLISNYDLSAGVFRVSENNSAALSLFRMCTKLKEIRQGKYYLFSYNTLTY